MARLPHLPYPSHSFISLIGAVVPFLHAPWPGWREGYFSGLHGVGRTFFEPMVAVGSSAAGREEGFPRELAMRGNASVSELV